MGGFQHKSVGTALTQAEYEQVDTGHQFASQATGMLLYASSSTVNTSLAIGATGQLLQVSGGIPAWTSQVRIPNGGDLVVGHTGQETISTDGSTDLVPEVQVLGTAASDASILIAAFSATATIAGSPVLAFAKGGHNTIGSHTVVTDGEELGNIVAYGDDGTDLESIAAQIQFESDGTPGTGDMPGRIVFATTADGSQAATERLRINSSGDLHIANGGGLVVGHTAQETISIGDGGTDLVPEVQVLGTAQADSSIMLATFSTTATSAGAPLIALVKGGNASIGSHTIVTDGEELGNIIAYGDDGVDLESVAAQIQFEVDGTPGAGDMPGRIIFATTADGSQASTEAMRITSSGDVLIANTNGLVIGHTSKEIISIGDGSTDLTPELQVLGTSQTDASLMLAAFSTTATAAGAPLIALAKGGHANIGSHTVVTDGEELGNIIAFGDDGTDLESVAAQIQFEVDGSPSTGDMPGRIIFATTADGAETATERLRINANGQVIQAGGLFLINESANGGMTTGITINQGAADDQILALKSSDIAVDMTAVVEADTYGAFSKRHATQGGLHIEGFGTDERGINMTAYLGSVTTVQNSVSSEAGINLRVTMTDGSTGVQYPSSNANLFAVSRYDGSTTQVVFIVDEDGDLFADGSATTVYDEYDDTALVRAIDLTVNPEKVIRNE